MAGLITDATDEELSRYAAAIKREQCRRRTLATAEKQVADLSAAYLHAAGIEPGQEWVQPTNAVNAYPEGWEVTFEGKTWVSLHGANVHAPMVSGWREVVEEDAAPAEWVQPSGGHDVYRLGDRVTFEGEVFESLLDANSWSPSAYPAGWKRVEEDA